MREPARQQARQQRDCRLVGGRLVGRRWRSSSGIAGEEARRVQQPEVFLRFRALAQFHRAFDRFSAGWRAAASAAVIRQRVFERLPVRPSVIHQRQNSTVRIL
jgi:hypothetical protein